VALKQRNESIHCEKEYTKCLNSVRIGPPQPTFMSRVSAKVYYVYVLWSPRAERFYIGISENPQRRLEVQRPLAGIHDLWYVIVAAGLQQQHADVRVFGKTTRHHRSGRPRSADDEVILRL
jgi:hypothetical protein